MTLTLTFGRYLQKQKCKVSWVCRIYCKKKNLDRCKTVACRRCDRQTDRQTVLTNILCENALWAFRKVMKPLGEWVLCEIASFSECIIDIDYNMSMSKVKNTVNLVVMHQMKSVQWIVYYLGYNITTIATKYVTLT